MSIRALYRAVTIDQVSPPYNTVHLKVFYPVQSDGGDRSQNLGPVPADPEQAPFSIVVLFNGINCGPAVYQWLAIHLAERGLVVVTFSWIAENLPGMVALTPGVDIARLAPDAYGSGPTASALPAILKMLEALQAAGPLAGQLDLQQVVLGGHSAGGRVAIESASPRFFPQVVAAFAYGAHTAGVQQLGYPAGKILPLPDELPLLLVGGTQDGVIANSSRTYGVDWEQPTTPVQRTFDEAIAGGRGDSYLLLVEGARHFTVVHPFDDTVSSAALDFPVAQPEDPMRYLIAEAIGLFIDAHVRHHDSAPAVLKAYLKPENPLIAAFQQK